MAQPVNVNSLVQATSDVCVLTSTVHLLDLDLLNLDLDLLDLLDLDLDSPHQWTGPVAPLAHH